MLELIVYPKSKDSKLINNSPFCSKAEIFLKLVKLDYKITEFTGNPSKFKKGKLPVIKHKDIHIGDSSLIQKYIQKEFKVDLDTNLSALEKAQGYAFAKMCEEFLYWSILHERWFIDSNWVKLRDGYFSEIPKLIRGLVTNMIRKQCKKSALGHGMSRHTDEEVLQHGKDCIQSLTDFLKDKKFILGDKPTSYDSTIYAFVSSILHSELGPELKKSIAQFNNLIEYDQRMHSLLFS